MIADFTFSTTPRIAPARRTHMRWYPLLRRIAREVEWPAEAAVTPYQLDLMTRRLYAAYFHGYAAADAWPPPADEGALNPVSDPDDAFVARLHAEFGGRNRLRSRLLGYFTIHGPRRGSEPARPTTRCYLNLAADSAPEVFARLAAELEHVGIPYAGKLLDNPANFDRPDSAVFYANRADAAAVVRCAGAVYDADAFGAEVPAFTREVLPGVAVADDPGGGMSFGYHRCALVAHGVAAAGAVDPHARLGAVIDSFLRAGIDPARPHLGPAMPELVLEGATTTT